jgi:hypothetical protein
MVFKFFSLLTDVKYFDNLNSNVIIVQGMFINYLIITLPLSGDFPSLNPDSLRLSHNNLAPHLHVA